MHVFVDGNMAITNFITSSVLRRQQCLIRQVRGYKNTRVFGYRPDLEKSLVNGKINYEVPQNVDHNVIKLVDEYKKYGHFLAYNSINPLSSQAIDDSERYSETIKRIKSDIDELKQQVESITSVETKVLLNNDKEKMSGSELVHFLDTKYGQSSPISIEFMNIPDPVERKWISNEFESINQSDHKPLEKKFAQLMVEAEIIELFMGKKFPSVKRYSGEGGESMSVFFHQMFRQLDSFSCPDVFVGMAHRGRLAFLIQHLKFPPAMMFRKMTGKTEVDLLKYPNSTGDVLSHLFLSSNVNDDGLHVTLLPNPSHLEAVSPVVVGASRGSALKHKVSNYSTNENAKPLLSPLAVQVHGDGSFTGQGVVMETIAMSQLPHFNVDGSIHLIVNNQIGYTAPSARGRSSFYSSDLMKMIDTPVIHVNGSDPLSVAMSAQFAIKYRNTFKKDILIDLICYRKHGHNELDDPMFTNPKMYQEIHNSKTLPEKYGRKVLEEDEYQSIRKNYELYLNDEFKYSQNESFLLKDFNFQSKELKRASRDQITIWDTGYDVDTLKNIGMATITFPEAFNLHPTLKKALVDSRTKMLSSGEKIDWSTAEALAFGSLLDAGINVRLVGQDVGRGTFSQRHAMVVDQQSGDIVIPLNEMESTKGGKMEIVNSHLSEEAVMAFEYGFSIISPESNLVIWEAQFGDFFNGAQIIIDTMVSSGELKWTLQTNMVLLLPHGFDGAGPEHSSCRIERFLQMCDSKFDAVDGDDVNMSIVNPTTPVQYFHLLRRQMRRPFKKPLIVVSPKILLRHPEAVSNISEFSPMNYFKAVLDDATVSSPSNVTKVIFCSGKHFYALDKERKSKNHSNVAIVRLEELCPFPATQIIQILNKYSSAKSLIWSQEEHMNMGAYNFVSSRFSNLLKRNDLIYKGRNALGSPATGIGEIHKIEAVEVVENAFK